MKNIHIITRNQIPDQEIGPSENRTLFQYSSKTAL